MKWYEAEITERFVFTRRYTALAESREEAVAAIEEEHHEWALTHETEMREGSVWVATLDPTVLKEEA